MSSPKQSFGSELMAPGYARLERHAANRPAKPDRSADGGLDD